MKFKSEVELQGDQKIENEFLIFIIVIHFGRQKANLQDPSRIKNYVPGAEHPPPSYLLLLFRGHPAVF